MNKDLNDVTVISVVCKTKELFKVAYESLRYYYPNINFIIINGLAGDKCTDYLDSIKANDTNMELFKFEHNIGHGPGMHAALCFAKDKYKYAYIIDSDTRQEYPVIEEFLKRKPEKFYAMGSVGTVNDKGFAAKEDSCIPYLHPSIMFLDIEYYFKRRPFHEHGAPILNAMKDLHKRNESDMLIKFPVRDYVFHNWRGTRNITRK